MKLLQLLWAFRLESRLTSISKGRMWDVLDFRDLGALVHFVTHLKSRWPEI